MSEMVIKIVKIYRKFLLCVIRVPRRWHEIPIGRNLLRLVTVQEPKEHTSSRIARTLMAAVFHDFVFTAQDLHDRRREENGRWTFSWHAMRNTEYHTIGSLLLQDLMKLFNEFLFLYSFFVPHLYRIIFPPFGTFLIRLFPILIMFDAVWKYLTMFEDAWMQHFCNWFDLIEKNVDKQSKG